jgi:hypothetical protein
MGGPVKDSKLRRATIKLRRAAIAFGRGVDEEPADDHDKKGQRLNTALLKAAREYARTERLLEHLK